MIDLKFANQLKNESIKTAEEMGLFPEEVIQKLYDVKIVVLEGFPPEDNIIFGRTAWYLYPTDNGRCKERNVVEVYSRNYSESFNLFFDLLKRKGVYTSELERKIRQNFKEEDLFLIYNQSGMDHELLGHIGAKLNGLAGNERDACVIEYQVARYHGKHDKKWEIAAEVTPLFQKSHRGIPLSEYDNEI